MDETLYRGRLVRFYLELDRSFFLDESMKAMAQYDGPLPIGHGQTISQPSLVLEMTSLLHPEPIHKVLEIGTGSGYQTALLAEFSSQVYTIERIPDLAARAQERLRELGYENVFFKTGDGSDGWPEFAPYDRIIVTAAAGHRPSVLIEQLAPNGRMIVPIGPPAVQELMLIRKDASGKVTEKNMGGVRFVEFIGKYGWQQ